MNLVFNSVDIDAVDSAAANHSLQDAAQNALNALQSQRNSAGHFIVNSNNVETIINDVVQIVNLESARHYGENTDLVHEIKDGLHGLAGLANDPAYASTSEYASHTVWEFLHNINVSSNAVQSDIFNNDAISGYYDYLNLGATTQNLVGTLGVFTGRT